MVRLLLSCESIDSAVIGSQKLAFRHHSSFRAVAIRGFKTVLKILS
jgi:hypothetical protein